MVGLKLEQVPLFSKCLLSSVWYRQKRAQVVRIPGFYRDASVIIDAKEGRHAPTPATWSGVENPYSYACACVGCCDGRRKKPAKTVKK